MYPSVNETVSFADREGYAREIDALVALDMDGFDITDQYEGIDLSDLPDAD